MNKLALLALLICVAPVNAVDIRHGMVITLSETEAAQCEAEGGCHVISRDAALAAIGKAGKAMAGDCMAGVRYRP